MPHNDGQRDELNFCKVLFALCKIILDVRTILSRSVLYGVLGDMLSKELAISLTSFLLVNWHVVSFLAVGRKFLVGGGIVLLFSNSSRLSESKSRLIYSSSSAGSKRLQILSNQFSSLSSQDGYAKIGKIYLNGKKTGRINKLQPPKICTSSCVLLCICLLYHVTSNHLVSLDFEGLGAVIGPIISPNSDDVVLVGVVEVDIIFVDKMLKIWCCRHGSNSLAISLESLLPCWIK